MKTINNKKYYTTQDIAELFEVSKESVLKWISSGKMKCNKISPKKFWITEEQIEEYINRGKQL